MSVRLLVRILLVLLARGDETVKNRVLPPVTAEGKQIMRKPTFFSARASNIAALLLLAVFLNGCDSSTEDPGQTSKLSKAEQESKDDGDDPTDTPPPTIYGEEIDIAQPCNVDFPRFHIDASRSIADLDTEYVDQPFRRGADLYSTYIAGTFTAPGPFESVWPHGGRTAVHLFFIEFPVNSANYCIGKAWEHNEMWARDEPSNNYVLVRDSTDPINGVPDPGPDQAGDTHWVVGTGRADPNFPEALILIDAPGAYRFDHRVEFGQYINQRANIHDSFPPWVIRGTASLRMYLRRESGVFTSGLGGAAAGGTQQTGSINANVSGYPANAPDLIPDVFTGHPEYVGR